MTEPKAMIYLRAGGAERFRKDTSKIFRKRDNPTLLEIDVKLNAYPIIPAQNFNQRAQALVAIRTLCVQWLDAKKTRTDGHGSFRAPVIKDLLVAVEAALRGVEEAQTISADRKARDAIAAKEIQDRITAQKNWAIARNGVRQLFPKGSTQGANGRPVQPMHPHNYLEVLDPQHRRGQELMYHFMDWERDDRFQGNFWDYLNKLNPEQLHKLQEFKVTYVDNLAFRDLFIVNFAGGLMRSCMSPTVQNMIMSNAALDQVKANAGEKLLDTTTWNSQSLNGVESVGWGAFVLSPAEVLYVGEHKNAKFHHSSFLCGAPVLAAGMIKVKQGRVVAIHEKNGHYRSQEHHMKSFLALLKRNMPGTDWSQVPYHGFHATQPTTVAQMLNLQPPQSVAKGPQPSTVGYSTMQRSGRPLPQPPAQQKDSGRPLPQPPSSPPKGNVRNLINRFNKG